MTALRRTSCIPLAALVLVLAAPACKREAKPVARVGSERIGLVQWRAYRAEQPKDLTNQAVLDDLVRREVAWHQAEKAGLLKGEPWQEASAKMRKTVLVRAYLDSLPGKPPATELEVKGFFLSHGEERHVLHVLAKTEKAAAAARARIAKGEPFERVAETLSTDPSAAKNHGDLGWVRRGAVVPEFAQVVFNAKEGEVSAPFQTQFGWHVAVVKGVRAPTEADFEKQKGRLMEEARDLVNAPKRAEALKTLKTEYPLTVDQAVLEFSVQPPKGKPNPADGKRVVGKVGGVGITLKELDAFIQESMAGGLEHSLGAATRQRFLDLLGDDIRLMLAAEKANLHKRPEVEAAVWNLWRKSVFQAYKLHHLRALKVEDAPLAAHLAQYPDRFAGVGAVKVNLLVAQDQAAATEAAKEAEKGAAWKTLVAKYANAESTGNWDPGFLEIAALRKALPPEVVKAMEHEPAGAILGPLQGPEGPMLFKILDRKPGPVRPLDQCREEVRVDYLASHDEELLRTYLDGPGRAGLAIEVHPENIQP